MRHLQCVQLSPLGIRGSKEEKMQDCFYFLGLIINYADEEQTRSDVNRFQDHASLLFSTHKVQSKKNMQF